MKISGIISNSEEKKYNWEKISANRLRFFNRFGVLFYVWLCAYLCHVSTTVSVFVWLSMDAIHDLQIQHRTLSAYLFVCLSMLIFVSVYLCWSISRWERYIILFQFNTEPTLRNGSPCAPALLTWDPKLLTDSFFFFIAPLLFNMFINAIIDKLTPTKRLFELQTPCSLFSHFFWIQSTHISVQIFHN